MKKKILVIGSLNMDMDIQMEHMPQVGETVLGKSIEYVPGGKGANQACAAARMGGFVTMLGCLGADELGQQEKQSLEDAGVDVSRIQICEKTATGMAIIYIDHSGNNHIVVIPGANGACSCEYLDQNQELLEESDYLVFQMEIPFETIFYGIRKGKALGKTIVWNPAPAPEAEQIPEDIWGMVDYITPNETELCKLSGVENFTLEGYKEGARKLLKKGVKNVLVTLGSVGALLVNDEKEVVIPARKVQAVDTTAAGDCFHGAFLTGLAEGMEVEKAIRFGNLASSIAVTKKGAQSSLPNRDEVEELVRMEEENR